MRFWFWPAFLLAFSASAATKPLSSTAPLRLKEDFRLQDPLRRAVAERLQSREQKTEPDLDPELPFKLAERPAGKPGLTVALLDTGVDLARPVLPTLWINKGEIGVDADGKDRRNNGIDDDGNGFVDDVFGWDFVDGDNRPHDRKRPVLEVLARGGNPGHGTRNAEDLRTSAPAATRVMNIRMLSDKAEGSLDQALGAFRYALDNGAQLIVAAWNFGRKMPAALLPLFEEAHEKGILVVAPAGSGFPSFDNLITVSNDEADEGADLLAAIEDTITDAEPSGDVDFENHGFRLSWDGISRSVTRVAGAAARFWEAHPGKKAADVKDALISTARRPPLVESDKARAGMLDEAALMGPTKAR